MAFQVTLYLKKDSSSINIHVLLGITDLLHVVSVTGSSVSASEADEDNSSTEVIGEYGGAVTAEHVPDSESELSLKLEL